MANPPVSPLTVEELAHGTQRCHEHQAAYGPQHMLHGERCWCYQLERACEGNQRYLALCEGVRALIADLEPFKVTLSRVAPLLAELHKLLLDAPPERADNPREERS